MRNKPFVSRHDLKVAYWNIVFTVFALVVVIVTITLIALSGGPQ